MASVIAIADDLTGAADCASPCAVRGMTASVILHGGSHPDLSSHWPEADVVSIDANTRGVSEEEAKRTITAMAASCCVRAPEAILFKKIDSTLRGNLAAELAATLRAYREAQGINSKSVMILAPALPAEGRTTIDGRQMVHGKPLEQTDLWKNESSLPSSNIAEILAEGGLSSHIIKFTAVRKGIESLTRTLANLGPTVDVLICDSETDDDLRRIGQAAVEGGFSLWAGSAGLAGQFPSVTGLQKRENIRGRSFAAGPTLTVVGSAASITREQAGRLAALSDVTSVKISFDVEQDAERKSREVIAALSSGHDTLVLMDGELTHQDHFTQALSEFVTPCANLLGGLIATGGETARGVLDTLGIDRLQLLGEVRPGLPFSVAEGWLRPLPVVTKAGAFGPPDALIQCRDFLRDLQHSSRAAAQNVAAMQEK